jgi:regulator of sigma E protease
MDWVQKILQTPWEFITSYGGPFVLVLSVLVFVHEWGHYIIARLCGVKIEKFSIGFGPEIFGRTDKNGTRWKFCLIPLGGYVQMFGDADPASARHTEEVQDGKKVRALTASEKKVAFFAQPVGRRAAIVFAGPAINYIFAIIILSGLYMVQGQPYTPPIAAGVVESSPAARAGIRVDDRIIAVNGVEISKFQDLQKFTMLNLNKEMEVTVQRSAGKNKWREKPVTLKVTPELKIEEDRFGFKHSTGRIGVSSPSSAFEMQKHAPLAAIGAATLETWTISRDTLKAIGQMIMGFRSADELGGILRIGAYAGEFAKRGAVAFITFAALLSVNLGLINLLPIPMLDGGHLAMYAMEKLRGKPLSERIQDYALRFGIAVLLAIMVFATWNDLVQMKVVDHVVKLVF